MSKQRHSSADRKLSVFERLGSKAVSKSKRLSNQHGEGSLLKATKVLKTLSVLDSLVKSEVAEMKKSHGKKGKEKHRRSRKTPNPPEPTAWDSLDLGDLEGADEKFLQKRRLQLQRELRLQLKREKGASKKAKKSEKKVRVARPPSSSSTSSSETSSSSSSSSSSYQKKRHSARKRKASPSSASEESFHAKKKKSPKPSPKVKIDVKKKAPSPRKVEPPRKPVVKKSVSPEWNRRALSPKKKSPPRSKPKPSSPKHKGREPSPRRPAKPKERRPSPPRVTRPRTPERRHRHSPRPRHGGLEKGGKILPVKSSAYVKEMKESLRRKTPDRVREEKEKEKLKEKRRREQKAREARETERREREREAERAKREAERQKERDDALQRCRERQRERERGDRIEREKRAKEFERKELDSRKAEVKSDLPSLLDIKTEAPREVGRRGWEDRRTRRPDDNFDFRRLPREELEAGEDRRGRKGHDYLREPPPWEGKDDFREPPPGGDWGLDWKPRSFEPKWTGDGAREGSWREREHYQPRRPADWHAEPPPLDEPRIEDRPPLNAVVVAEPPPASDMAPVEGTGDLEEVLSDISDDPDDILNQVDEPVVEPVETTPAQLIPATLSQPSAEFFFDSRRPLLECLGDRGLDFEEISDEELEEEAKMGKGIMDVLGADWASLMKRPPKATPRAEVTTSARRRWRVDCVISRIGISRTLAGDDFADEFLARIRSQGREADKETEVSKKDTKQDPGLEIKTEEPDELTSDSIKDENAQKNNSEELLSVKEELKEVDEKGEKEGEWRFLHPLPSVHSMLAELPDASPVCRLLNPKFKHALSARNDLAIRRVVCGLSTAEPLQFGACDEALHEMSLALFKSAVA